jgi:outer membrane protein TolC
MTLSEAITYARAHHPTMQVALARVAAAKADANIPRAQWLPQVGALGQVVVGTSNNTSASITSNNVVDLPRIGGTTAQSTGDWTPSGNTLVAVGIRQEIFDFGRIAIQSVTFDDEIEAQKASADNELLALCEVIREAYFSVVVAKQVVDVAEAAYGRALVHRDFAKAGVDAKLHAPSELLRTEADLARFDVARQQARGNVSVAQAVLAAAVGVPGASLDIKDDPVAFADVGTLDAIFDQASQKNPQLRMAIAQLRAQEGQTDAIRAEMLPNLYASGTLSGRAGGAATNTPLGDGWLPVVPNWDVALVLSWPLFDPVVSARAKASESREALRRAQIDESQLLIVADIRRRYAEFVVARDSLPALDRAVDAAKVNEQQVQARFQGGLANSVELADAEALLADAEIRRAMGRFDMYRSRARLSRAIAEDL